MKELNDDLQMRSRLAAAALHRGERLKNDDGRKMHPTQKPEALLHRVMLVVDQPGRRDPRSLLRHRHHRRGGQAAAAATSSASSASDAYAEAARARIAAVDPLPIARASRSRRRKRAEPRIPFGALIERGLVQPGEPLLRSAPSASPRGCAPTAPSPAAGAHRARSTRSARMCRARPPATAGPSGTIEAEGALMPIDASAPAAARGEA